jgi:tetratricopeptide (TPR) repeat protein
MEINNIHLLLADTYKDSTMYNDAVKYYSKALDYKYSNGACMMVANIYDDKLKEYDNALPFYKLFLNNYEKDIFRPDSAYIDRVNKRVNWLVKNKNKKK